MNQDQIKGIIIRITRNLEEKIGILEGEVESIRRSSPNIEKVLDSIRGKDGRNPVYGEDWNLSDEDISKIVEQAKPVEGVDYFMPKDGKDAEVTDELVTRIVSLALKEVRNGKDGKDGTNGIDGMDGIDGKDGKDGRDGSPDTAEQIADKINTLEGAIEAKAIRNLPKFTREVIREVGGRAGAMETPIKKSDGSALGKDASGAWVLPSSSGGDPTIGNTVIGADPNLFLYTDASGNLYQDELASRDSATNVTSIGYETGGGDFSNAIKLGDFLGGGLSDGAGLQRHDNVNDNYAFIGTVDMTPFGGGTNELLGAYADFTNGIFATTTLSNIESAFDYSNSVTGTDGHIVINSTRISLEHTDNSTYDSRIMIDNTIDLQTDGTGGKNLFRVSDTFIRGGSASFYFYADTIDDTFYVRGQLPITGTPSGSLLFVDLPNAVSTLGDYNEQMSHIKVVADVANGNAYIDGLASPVPNWTPSTLSDGFTGTGLNDMNYDSTVTYTGTYPNTYTATIASVGSVHITLTSITTPGFTVGDTVTDGASTGTIIAGSDGDGFIIIQPIIDSGWTSATSITDISSGAAASVGSPYYTDTMSWSSTGGGSGIIIPTSSFINLGDGLSVGFGSQTGHTLGDLWEWTMLQGTVYSKMALFDGANRTMSIGDVEQTVNDVRTDWVLGTGKNHGIYEYLGDAQEYHISNSSGDIVVLDSDTFNQTILFSIQDPFYGQTPFSVETGHGAYGFRFQLFDAGQHYATLGAEGLGNNTFLNVNDDTETITLTASHISAPLSAYADDADAGTNGVITGELYQTDGTGSAPLNVAGIVMIKQ